MKRLLLLLLCAATLGGCDSGLDEWITLVNESPQPLRFQADTLEPGGGVEMVRVTECTDDPLILMTEGGVEYARLDLEYCPGQRWTITGPGEIVLD